MADKCLTRIENVLKKSSIATEKAQGILDDIKKAQSETKITDLDETITSKLADGVLKRQALQKKINKLNALEDEVKVRNTVEYVLKEFPNDPVEGLTAVLVGSNLQKSGSRSSVALAQLAYYRDLLVSFNAKLRENKVDSLFAEANADIEKKVARVIWEVGSGKEVTVKDKDIVTLGKLINEFSGEYFINLRDREYNSDKTDKINNMTGNIPDLYDPASKYNGIYPNSFKSTDFEPSIRGRKLYIPIDCWFGQDSYMNIPLISLQYQIMHIKVLFRPIKELYVVSNQLNDEYIDNYLFNEFPTYHNINFIINSDGEDLDKNLYNLKGQIIDAINANDDEINLQQSDTTLDILFKLSVLIKDN